MRTASITIVDIVHLEIESALSSFSTASTIASCIDEGGIKETTIESIDFLAEKVKRLNELKKKGRRDKN